MKQGVLIGRRVAGRQRCYDRYLTQKEDKTNLATVGTS